ncbi:hypothetical protein BKA93DRAFT_829264 [Sparassis latifolia]
MSMGESSKKTMAQDVHAFPLLDSFHSALGDSLLGRNFTDVRFYLFSQRLQSGRVGTPREVYANSDVLKAASPYFESLLATVLAESNDGTQPESPSDRLLSTDSYAYELDSDIDEEDDGDPHDDSGDISRALSQHDAPDGGTLSSQQDLAILPNGSAPLSPTSNVTVPAAGSPLRTIVIPDAAFITWQSLVFYLYTGTVSFAPLRSQGLQVRMVEKEQHSRKFPRRPPLCSPKSMYRLADKLGIDQLKELAAADIRTKLSADNILDELFSSFTNQHPQILDAERDFFCDRCLNVDIIPALIQKLNTVAGGHLPHAGAVLTSLFRAWITMAQVAEVRLSLGTPTQKNDQITEAFIITPQENMKEQKALDTTASEEESVEAIAPAFGKSNKKKMGKGRPTTYR